MSKPELPNKILPPGWEVATIGDLCDLKNGYAFKPADWSTKGLPIVRIQNLNNPKAPFNYYSGELRDRFVINNGDLLFAWSGTPGTSFGAHIWRGGKAALNQHIFRVDFPESFLNKKYFMYAINQKLSSLIERAHGGVGLRHVTKGKFEDTNIELPPLNEQHRIVAKIEALFSELDIGIEALKTAREQLKIYRQAVLKHAFEGKLTVRWREENNDKLETHEQLLARIQQERQDRYQQQLKDWQATVKAWEKNGKVGKKPGKPRELKPVSEIAENVLETLPAIPENWAWQKLGWMTCWVEYGTAAKSSSEGKIPVIRMGNLQNGLIDWNDLVYTSDDEEIEKYSLNAGDVLFNRTNSPELVGKTAIYNGEHPAVFAGYLIRINHLSFSVDGRYLNFFLNSHIAKQHGNTVKTDGVNQSNINGEKLQGYPFPYCSLDEQIEIVRILEEKLSLTDYFFKDIGSEIEKSEALRQTILKKAFSGQLVPQDQNDEPASVLLERIKAEKQKSLSSGKRKRHKSTDKSLPLDNVIPMPQRISGMSTTDLHAGILALAYSSHQEKQRYAKTFHHVKGEKIAHMVEAHVAIDLDRTPVKDAAGPNDFPHLKKVESRAQKANWFLMKKDRASGAYNFKPGRNFENLHDKVKKALGEHQAKVESLLIKLKPLNTQQTEIVATLYAAWNNLLLLGKKPDDEEIVFEARENWHPAKLEIERWRFFKGLEWMRGNELIPAGTGKLVKSKGEAKSLQKSKRK